MIPPALRPLSSQLLFIYLLASSNIIRYCTCQKEIFLCISNAASIGAVNPATPIHYALFQLQFHFRQATLLSLLLELLLLLRIAFLMLLQRLPLHFLVASNLLVQHFCLTLALHQREMIGMPTSMTVAEREEQQEE